MRRRLFIAKGFDETTTREIGLRAGAASARYLFMPRTNAIFLIINDQLYEVTQSAHATINPAAAFIDNVMTVAKLHYQFFGEQLALSRLVFREMIFYESGAQAGRFQNTRQRLIGLFGRAVELAKAQKSIATKENPSFVGWTLFSFFGRAATLTLLGRP